MNTMTTTEFVTAAIPFVLALLIMMLAMYSWGYSRGARAIAPTQPEVVIDHWPEVFQRAEEAPITGPIQISVLEPTTGPIDIILPELAVGKYDEVEPLTPSAADEL